MLIYFFQLGNAVDLAVLELCSFLGINSSELILNKNVAYFKTSTQIDLKDLTYRLGGVVKCGEVVDEFEVLPGEDKLIEVLSSIIDSEQWFKFGLTLLDDNQNIVYRDLVKKLKRRLKELSNKSVDYLLPTGDSTSINAAQFTHVLHNAKGGEVFVQISHQKVYIGKVNYVQPVDLWSDFDFGRPQRRIFEGMLPSKVARMMLNIGLAHSKFEVGIKIKVLDPFCGSGTVLSEAARLGYSSVGIDIYADTVRSAQMNLHWTLERLQKDMYMRLPLTGDVDYGGLSVEILQGDAVHVNDLVRGSGVGLVVTEPYLGPLFVDPPEVQKARNVLKGLQKLYLGFFKSLRLVLSPGGVVVFALPTIKTAAGQELEVGIIDRLAEFGYTLIDKGVYYSRENSVVKRKIVVLSYGSR